VYQGPNDVCPRCGGHIGHFACKIGAVGDGNGVYVGAKEQEIYEDVDDLEKDTVLPGVCHGGRGWKGSLR